MEGCFAGEENSIEEYKLLLEERKKSHLKDGLLEIEINVDFKNRGYGTCRLCPEKISFQFMDDYIEHCRLEHLISVVILTPNGNVYSGSKFPPGYNNENHLGLGICGNSSLPEGSFIETEPPFLEDFKKYSNSIQIIPTKINETYDQPQENRRFSATNVRVNSKDSVEEAPTTNTVISEPVILTNQIKEVEKPSLPVNIPILKEASIFNTAHPEEISHTSQVTNNDEDSSSSSGSSDEMSTPLHHRDSYSDDSSESDSEIIGSENRPASSGSVTSSDVYQRHEFGKLLNNKLMTGYSDEIDRKRLGFTNRRIAKTPARFKDPPSPSGRSKETPERDEEYPDSDHSQREDESELIASTEIPKRKRGRPPKLFNDGTRMTQPTPTGIPRGRGTGKRGRGRGRGFRSAETLGKGSIQAMYESLPGGVIHPYSEFHDTTDQIIRKEGITIASGNFLVKKRGRPPGLFKNSGYIINRKPTVPGRKRGRPKKHVAPTLPLEEGPLMDCESFASENSIQNISIQGSTNKPTDMDTSSAIDDDSSVIQSQLSETNDSTRIDPDNSPSEWGIKNTVLSKIITAETFSE